MNGFRFQSDLCEMTY